METEEDLKYSPEFVCSVSQTLSLLKHFSVTPVAIVLFNIKGPVEEIFESYLADFVSLKHLAQTESELTTVTKIVRSALRLFFQDLETYLQKFQQENQIEIDPRILKTDLKYIPAVHQIYSRFSTRLDLLRQIILSAESCNCSKECVGQLETVNAGRELCSYFDLLALRYLLQCLCKQGEDLSKKVKEAGIEFELLKWSQNVLRVDLLAETVLSTGTIEIGSSSSSESPQHSQFSSDENLKREEFATCKYEFISSSIIFLSY